MSIAQQASAHTDAKQPIRPQQHAPSLEVAASLLSSARSLVEPRLREAVDALGEQTRPIALYAFGFADPAGNPDTASWGKGLRSALTLASTRAVGGDDVAAVPAAAAIELVHNASLIHDDLLDGDIVRRHRPAVWAAYDQAAAVLVGDALFHAAIRAVQGGPSQRAAGATAMLLDTVLELIDGEKADTAFETRHDVTVDECLTMAEAKTGALIGAACALGARFGGADEERIAAFNQYGRHLGVAYQAVDDALGIFGTPTSTGKPVLADLGRHKKSLPVVYALNAGTPAATEFADLYYGSEDLTTGQLQRAAELIEQTGARSWVHDYGRQQIARASEYLASALPTTQGLAELTVLSRLVTERNA